MVLSKILISSSAFGLVYGVANYLKNYYQTVYASSRYNGVVLEKIRSLSDLSRCISAEVNLKTRKYNNSEVIDVLRTLSYNTKHESFLRMFLQKEGVNLLDELLSLDDFRLDLTEEIMGDLSEVLANISQNTSSLNFLQSPTIAEIVAQWKEIDNLVINLNLTKMNENVNQLRKVSTHQRYTYAPDIFLLDSKSSLNCNEKTFDVVFINGMLGSVYHTWRQHDEAFSESPDHVRSKCWPQDWLSCEFPQARLLGVNALLRPFIWNKMADSDKIDRSMEKRAKSIADQLEQAGVGCRPIVWITHSAGGILLKQMLHLKGDRPLATSTIGVVFMSTPHSGAQSMLSLYHFPLKYILTPEAKHLETNSKKLLELNYWFKELVKIQNISILTLTETEPTKLNRLYHTVVVPINDGEFDKQSELKVKSDHLSINKPKNPEDEVYLEIRRFITNTVAIDVDSRTSVNTDAKA